MNEVDIQRLITKTFIDSDPISLILFHREKSGTPAGGFKWGDPEPRDPQTFRLIPQTDVMPTVQTPDGVTLLPGYVLLGEHDAVMARWDIFTFLTVEYQIVSPVRPDVRDPSRIYERKADVARI